MLMTIGVFMLLTTSCATYVKFPVSQIVPAAEISANKTKDNNNNYDIRVTAKYLANPNRLTPPKSVYVVWIVTEKNDIKNIGQLVQKGNKKVILKTTTPFAVKELFITAEDKGDVTYPSNTEVTRKKL